MKTSIILTTIVAGALTLSALAQQSQSTTGGQPTIDTTSGTIATTPSAANRANAEALFRRLDSDGDGMISREEFNRNAHQLPIGPQPGSNVTSPGATSPETPKRSTDADPRDDVPGNPPTGSGTRGATGNSPK